MSEDGGLERAAREIYESSLLTGASEVLAYDAVYGTCVAYTLKHLGGQDRTDLPESVDWLIQEVLMQVKMLLCRHLVICP